MPKDFLSQFFHETSPYGFRLKNCWFWWSFRWDIIILHSKPLTPQCSGIWNRWVNRCVKTGHPVRWLWLREASFWRNFRQESLPVSMTPGNLTLRCRRLQEDTVCIQPPIYIYSYIIQYYGDAELEPPTAVLNTAAVEESKWYEENSCWMVPTAGKFCLT